MSKKIFYLFAVVFFSSCLKETNLGEGLLSNDAISLSYKNDFKIEASTINSIDHQGFIFTTDIKLGTTNLVTPKIALIGNMDDPIYGKVSTSFYSRVTYATAGAINFKDYTLDSAVLVLQYDTTAMYGDQLAIQKISIQEILEDYKDYDSIAASKELTFNPNIIGYREVFPKPKDSITIINPVDTSVQKLPAHIRIRMDQNWATALLTNPSISTAPPTDQNNVLYSVFKGLRITSDSDGKALLALNMSDASIFSSGIVKLNFYLHNPSTNKKSVYGFQFNNQKYNHFKIDNSVAIVNDFINNPLKGDSLIFLQTMSGPDAYIDLKDLSKLKGKNINHAEINLTVAKLSNDLFSSIAPITQLVAYKRVNGKYEYITDIINLKSKSPQIPLPLGFGGNLTGKSTETQTYSLIITNHLKELLDQDTPDTKIYIAPELRYNSATRMAIYGAKHSTNPIAIKVVYSDK